MKNSWRSREIFCEYKKPKDVTEDIPIALEKDVVDDWAIRSKHLDLMNIE